MRAFQITGAAIRVPMARNKNVVLASSHARLPRCFRDLIKIFPGEYIRLIFTEPLPTTLARAHARCCTRRKVYGVLRLRYLRQGALIHVITGIVKRALLQRGPASELTRCKRVRARARDVDDDGDHGVRQNERERESVVAFRRTTALSPFVCTPEARSINRHHVGADSRASRELREIYAHTTT